MTNSHRHEARTILATATLDTHRPLLAWAVGATARSHAIHPLTYWRTRDARRLAPEYEGQTLPAGRMLRLDRARIEITDGTLRQPLRLTWADLGAVLDSDRVTDALIRHCEQTVIAWRDHPGGFRGVGWNDVLDACGRAGDAVWAACRPTDPGEQLDLFSLAGIES
ncbi:hypothetical protein Vqi01_34620 [Micromonospora qiuiae]|uniref:Uncharacterized protein n=1 Tax=Micromonospora qiuiae TaxID=502268 RepID=A0ABQ4JDR1_9ACTN|nr:hypothetical protein [Micromonospora qiuiae]GIJ28300.1 hypothetical protein Vqi01_34620 [Micromonospora qiuiae]